VVYVITPFGAFVERNERNFATLVRQRGTKYRFIVLAPAPAHNKRLPEYIAAMRPSWGATPVEVICDVPDQLRQSLNLFGYPDTIVVAPTGRVIRNFNGAYSDDSLSARPADIEAFFQIKLPGLNPERR
jgi:hypothetical protein